jgi:Domain of unknown function (DUF4403)
MKPKFLLFFFFAFSFTISQAQKLEKKPSIISLPIDFSIDDIQVTLNKSMPTVLLDDNSFEDNQKDELKAKVTKKGDVVFSSVNNDVISYEVPLKVWVQKRIAALGFAQYPSTEFEVKFKFATKFAIKPDYTISTITNAVGFEFITKPVLKTNVVDIPIGPVIEKVIDAKMATYAAEIDKTIANSFQLRPMVLEAWNTALIPTKVSEDYNTWIKIEPLEIFATPFKSEKRNLKAVLGFKVMIETIVGNPIIPTKKVTNIPMLRYVNTIPDEFEVQLFTIVDYATATDISKKMFVGQKYEFKDGKYKIEINDLQITAQDSFLLFKTNTKGSFKGDIYVKGIPKYDPIKQMIVLTKTELDVKTKNFLHKSAAWLLEGYMEKRIQSEFGMPVQEIIEYSKASVLQNINKEFTKGISMKGNVLSIIPKDIRVDSAGMYATINAKAKVELKIKGL